MCALKTMLVKKLLRRHRQQIKCLYLQRFGMVFDASDQMGCNPAIAKFGINSQRTEQGAVRLDLKPDYTHQSGALRSEQEMV